MKRYGSQIALLIALVFSLGISLLSDRIDAYYLDIALNVGINITLAVSLNLVNGHPRSARIWARCSGRWVGATRRAASGPSPGAVTRATTSFGKPWRG